MTVSDEMRLDRLEAAVAKVRKWNDEGDEATRHVLWPLTMMMELYDGISELGLIELKRDQLRAGRNEAKAPR